ncbi:MAG: transketolase [Candidatus Nanopelagicales bacterium]|nr:transketolase [Candidatus Nanopelagicales bacterium]
MDSVQKVGNGHPGTAMSLAPMAYLLFQKWLRHDPTDPKWQGRDRFVLSNGHSSITLYIQLFLSGYAMELDDLKSFRTWESSTPGHPEFGHTQGVEATTGPLGTGLATAVGMAMDARYVRNLLDPNAPAGTSVFDHRIWVIAGDGCLQEGVTSEASSLAGHQQLGNLFVLYDDNHISIEGDTQVSFTEDVLARYRAYGWNVLHVDMQNDGSIDVIGLDQAISEAVGQSDKPTLIRVRNIIGWPAPNLQNTGKIHGSALGEAEVAATKEILGVDATQTFQISEALLSHTRKVTQRGVAIHDNWNKSLENWSTANPTAALLYQRLLAREFPIDWHASIPRFEPGTSVATRKASGDTINAIAAVLPELWGGSADLADSNLTSIEHGNSFLPGNSEMPNANPGGRIIHYGIREFAMACAMNGMALGGITRPFAGTFLVFSDFMRGAVRLSALMNIPATYVWTHDSIGLGEDGPTHQPVEHLWALRAIPNLHVIRPADANETATAWRLILEANHPAGICLSRQNLPVLASAATSDVSKVGKGAYVISESSGEIAVILIATGSEVSLALAAQTTLERSGVSTRVVSAPCLEWFDNQSADYRESVLPSAVTARVSVEAGISQGWWKYVGTAGRCISLEHFGASAGAEKLYEEFGITSEAIVAAAQEILN